MAIRIFLMVSRVAFFWIILIALVLCLSLAFLPHGGSGIHSYCRWHEGMGFLWIECRNFPGSGVAGFLLSLPLNVFIYGPILLLAGTLNTSYTIALPLFYVAWLVLGIIYPVWWLCKKVKRALWRR
jgi:hypothetical protein